MNEIWGRKLQQEVMMSGFTQTVKTLSAILVCIGLVPMAASAGGAYLEKNGVVVLQVETTDSPLGKWVKHTSNNKYSWVKGFTGSACLQFTGNQESNGPATSILKYKIKISSPGTYECYLRGLEAPIQSGAGDQANDCYIAMKGQSDCEGKLTKMVLLGASYQWSWKVKLECGHHNFRVPTYNLSAGYHEFQIAGRSKNFFVDRVHIVKKGTSGAQDLSLPESQREDGGSTDPTPDPTPDPTGDATKITGPSVASLTKGQEYTLTGEGSNLQWSYDANSDGKGSISIGSGSSVQFTVPTDVSSPNELTLTLQGDNGTDSKLYSLATGTGTDPTPDPQPTGDPITLAAVDFEDQGNFYVDGGKWLAIQPGSSPISATATTTFSGSAGTYDLTLHAVGENDGSSSYKVYVGGSLVGEYTVPMSTQTFEEGSKYDKIWSGVSVPAGAEIKVTATTASADGQEWARARWRSVELTPVGQVSVARRPSPASISRPTRSLRVYGVDGRVLPARRIAEGSLRATPGLFIMESRSGQRRLLVK